MGRILAIDYGQKRTGIAVTDPLKIIAQAMETVETSKLIPFLNDYFSKEDVEEVIIGLPYHLDGNPTDNTERVLKFITRFKRIFTTIPIVEVDESYTSKMAVKTLVQAGLKKKDRQNKGNLDKVSAAIMLQEYLETKF